MKESWAIGLPGQSTIGTRVRLVISSVSVPLKPGSTNPAVACTIRPSRPRLDLPSIRATMSFGSSTHSTVLPSTNSPGWITNEALSSIFTCSVTPVGGSARSIAGSRWLWKTRNEVPSLRSTLAGWTIAGSHGSIIIRCSSTRRRIVPSDSTELITGAILATWPAGCPFPFSPATMGLTHVDSRAPRDHHHPRHRADRLRPEAAAGPWPFSRSRDARVQGLGHRQGQGRAARGLRREARADDGHAGQRAEARADDGYAGQRAEVLAAGAA